MQNLIINKKTHLVSTFKDYIIWDYIEEFLKRYYKEEENNEKVPKFSNFYINYLKLFSVPTFKDIFCNEMIHNYNEKKAELFYNENYRSKNEKKILSKNIMEYLKKVNQTKKVILLMQIIISKKQFLMRHLKKRKNIPR